MALVEREVRGTKTATVYLAELERWDEWRAMARRIADEYEIRTFGTIAATMAELARAYMGEPVEAAERVAIRDIFGQGYIPTEAAAVVKAAVDRMVDSGAVTKANRWQALEFLAAEYLGTPGGGDD